MIAFSKIQQSSFINYYRKGVNWNEKHWWMFNCLISPSHTHNCALAISNWKLISNGDASDERTLPNVRRRRVDSTSLFVVSIRSNDYLMLDIRHVSAVRLVVVVDYFRLKWKHKNDEFFIIHLADPIVHRRTTVSWYAYAVANPVASDNYALT